MAWWEAPVGYPSQERCLDLGYDQGQVLVPSPRAVKGACVDVCGSGHHWGLCRGLWSGYHLGSSWCPRAALPWDICQPGWLAQPPGAMLTTWLRLLPRIMSVSMVLRRPGSVLMSLTHDATGSSADAWGLGCNLLLCWCLRAVPLLGPGGSGLGCELGPWFCPDHGCRWGPCLGLWSNRSQCLCSYLWLLRPSKTLLRLGMWAYTWGHVGVWGPCCCGAMWVQVACTASWDHGDIWAPVCPWFYHSLSLCWCFCPMLSSKAT